MMSFKPSALVIWGLALVLGFSVMIATVEYEPLYVVLRAMLFTISAGVLVRWWPGMMAAFRGPKIDPGAQLSLGIWIAFAGSAAFGAYAMVQKFLGYPEYMWNSTVILAIISVQLLGAIIHLTSPGIAFGRVPARNWVSAAAWLALGGVLAGVALVLAIDPG